MSLASKSILERKITLALLLLAAGLGVGAAWWVSGVFVAERSGQVVQRALQQAQTDASVLGGNISHRLAQAGALPGLLNQDHDIQTALGAVGPHVSPSKLEVAERAARWAAVPEWAAISQRLTEVVTTFNLNTAWVTNAAGDTLAEGHTADVRPFLGTNYADRDYFKAAQRGQLGRQFAVGRVTKLYALYFAAPVTWQGQFVGMVGTSVRLDSLLPLLSDVHVLVTDEHGVVVLSADPALQLRVLPNATVGALTEAQRVQRYQRHTFEPLALEKLAGDGPQALYQWPLDAPNPHVWVTRATLDGALQVHVLREVGDELAQLSQDRWSWFGLTCLAWFLLLGFVGVLSTYLVLSREQRQELLVLNGELQRQANTDVLTGGASRRHYLEVLHQEQERAQRYGLSFCVLSLDIDHFKHVNDTHGHAAGDAVLRHFAVVVQGLLRQSDVFGRVGGEEFSVLLPQTTGEGGWQMAQRIRAAVEASPSLWEDRLIPITVSVGGVQWLAGQLSTVDQVLAASDRALYQAKNQGRNRVVWAASATETWAVDHDSPTTRVT